MLLSKDECKETAWYKAADRGHLELLKKLWDWAKEVQLTPEELRNEILLSRDYFGHTVWHMAAENRDIDVLSILGEWAKELHLKQGELLK